MKLLFRCAALSMALTTAVVSTNSYTSGASASVSATVIEPAKINFTASRFAVVASGNGDMGSLVIRLPGAAAPGVDNREQNITSPLLGTMDGNCLVAVESLAGCLRRNPDSDLLEGDPVSSLTLSVNDGIQPGNSTVILHIAFN